MFCSFVITTRNDNYGNFSPQDFRLYLEVLIKQLSGSSREFEIIVVQWNTVESNPCFSEVLELIDCKKNIHIRFFSVPSIYHSKFLYSDLKPFCAEGAVNFGIRRATGTFCCLKVQDTVYSEPLALWLREGQFDKDKIYRAIRFDHNYDRVEDFSEVDLKHGGVFKYSPSGKYFTNACGDFMLMPTKVFHAMRGWADSGRVVNTGYDGITLARAICHGLSQDILPNDCAVLKKTHEKMFRLRTTRKHTSVFNVLLHRIWGGLGKPSALRLPYKLVIFFSLLLGGVTGFPRVKEVGVPVDNWGRYFLKFYFNLYFSKFFNGNSSDWGLPDARVTEKRICG